MRYVSVILFVFVACASPGPRMEAQYPSPMAEHTRAHERIPTPDTLRPDFEVTGVLDRPVPVFLSPDVDSAAPVLIHFHGPASIPAHTARTSPVPLVTAAVNLGSGSSVYERAFFDPVTLDRLLDQLAQVIGRQLNRSFRPTSLYLSGFSAGYGAVRAVLRRPDAADRVDGVLLLDGLHTDYVPARRPLAAGGALNGEKMAPFLAYARAAVAGEVAFVFTHSAVFPGTYASTTECADFLLDAIGLRRTPVLRWGPVGMQLLSEAGAGRFRVLGFAGNTAPDHVDHLHALPDLVRMLEDPSK